MTALTTSLLPSRPRIGLRSLMLAAALALLLVPLMESRASAAWGVHGFCRTTVTTDKSKWVPPHSYCLSATPGYYPQLYGYWTWNEVGGSNNGLRKCAIIDVYSNISSLKVKRFQACSTSSMARAYITSQYANVWLYSMFVYVYNGSSQRQLLGGWAAGYPR